MKKSASYQEKSYSDTDNDEKDRSGNSTDKLSTLDQDDSKNKAKEPVTLKKVFVRSATASCLALLYFSILMAGHFYCILAVALTQTQLYREIVNVRYREARERSMPWFRTLQWSWFNVAMIFVYGETLHRFCSEHKALNRFLYITENFSYITYMMYWLIFITSVLTLRPGLIRFQLSQHMWSIVTVCMVVFQCKYFASNTLKGLFWYVFPMATVIVNDVSAYFVGITFGRKFITAPFLALSPNKTWEGFLGAFLFTMMFSFLFPAVLAKYTWFTCPAEELSVSVFHEPLTCTPNSVFMLHTYSLPSWSPYSSTQLYPMQLHGLVYGLFASFVAPFGGFFASAIKRAYNKKDFDSFMPGHGGMMDRMDCQLVMITFSSFYIQHFIAGRDSMPLERMLLLAMKLPVEQQLLLWKELGNSLGMAGVDAKNMVCTS